MERTIVISGCQVAIWDSESSRKQFSLSGLEFCFSPDKHHIIIRQHSGLHPTNSFVAYKLEVSSCTHLDLERLPEDGKTISLRLNETVAASICVDKSISPAIIADEVATLKMCPMADTSLPIGYEIDLIIPQQSLHVDAISQLLQLIERDTEKEESPSSQVQSPTLSSKDSTQATSLNLSNDDFKYLEASVKLQQPKTTKPKLDRGRVWDAKKALEEERSLVDAWAKQKEMWELLSTPEGKQNTSMARQTVSYPKMDDDQKYRAQWVGFAAFHAASKGSRSAATPQENGPVGSSGPDWQQTGGYLQQLFRDFDRAPHGSPTGNRGQRRYGKCKLASFIPPINPSTKRPQREPDW